MAITLCNVGSAALGAKAAAMWVSVVSATVQCDGSTPDCKSLLRGWGGGAPIRRVWDNQIVKQYLSDKEGSTLQVQKGRLGLTLLPTHSCTCVT